jgi:hypothetical protein
MQSMIPHHQGAIDMAKIEMTYGKDGNTEIGGRHHQGAGGRDRRDERLARKAPAQVNRC